MSQNELRFVSLVGDAGRHSPVQAIANTLDELAPDDVQVDILDEPLRLPRFSDDDSDSALPFEVGVMRSHIAGADAVVIVTPDVMGSKPSVLTNALDWLGACSSQPLGGREVMVVTVSAGSSVGSCLPLRRILSSLGATVLDGAGAAVSDVGRKVDSRTACLRDEATRRLIGGQLAALASLIRERRDQSSRPS